MIEVEKKFLIDKSELSGLLEGAEFVSEKKITDVYWDTSDHSLTTKDLWLRLREGRFELKVPTLEGGKRLVDQYEELDSDDQITSKLNLEAGDLEKILKGAGYNPFASITTLRKKYKKEGFIIDVDEVDFGYNIVEVELMVSDKSEISDAINKIFSFANSYGLKVGQVRGKIVEYIKRNRQEHYKALIESGIVRE